MNRRLFILGMVTTTASVAVAGPVLAASYAEDVVAQLTSFGFSNISVETTWLGRIRILASRSDGIREIILNPRTGEILRDVWMPASGRASRVVLDDVDEVDEDDDDSGSGSGTDDGADDNSGSDDGDNSGHGGGDDDGGDSSGSGSGGSGSGDDDGTDD